MHTLYSKGNYLKGGTEMKSTKVKVLDGIAKLSKKAVQLAEGKQSIFLSFEPKKPSKK